MSLTTLEIDGRLVGEGQPCYIIAEAVLTLLRREGALCL